MSPEAVALVHEPLIRAYQDRGLTFVQGYGLTGTSPGALFLRARESVRKAGSAGTACFFTDVRVEAETGEVLISGPNVTPGYWAARRWLASGSPPATPRPWTPTGTCTSRGG
jgi:fatty-acyl-CoA synthase